MNRPIAALTATASALVPIATCGFFENDVTLWDVSDRRTPTRLGQPLTGHTDTVHGVEFLDPLEVAVLGAPVHDPLGQHRSHARDLGQFVGSGRVQVDLPCCGKCAGTASRAPGDAGITGRGTTGRDCFTPPRNQDLLPVLEDSREIQLVRVRARGTASGRGNGLVQPAAPASGAPSPRS